MEANMYDALKAPKPPAIGYIVADFEILPSLVGEDLTVEAVGKMSVRVLSARTNERQTGKTCRWDAASSRNRPNSHDRFRHRCRHARGSAFCVLPTRF
jgi:hypothetical protein